MTIRTLAAKLVAAAMLTALAALPVAASAQQHNDHDHHPRPVRHTPPPRRVPPPVRRDGRRPITQQQIRAQRNHQAAQVRVWERKDARNRARTAAAAAAVVRAKQARAREQWEKRHWANEHRQWEIEHNRRPLVIHRPTTIYRPEVIYRTVPTVRYRYIYDRGPHWYPSTPPNEWRNIAEIFGGVALLGVLQHDNTLIFAGGLGALYSLSRFEADRHSANRANRLRAAYFERPYFFREGHRYDRELVVHNGHRYYRFARR